MMHDDWVVIQKLNFSHHNHVIFDDIDLTVQRGKITAIMGPSGSGKTTILRSVLMLLKPTSGSIRVFGQDISALDEPAANALRRRWGMLEWPSLLRKLDRSDPSYAH